MTSKYELREELREVQETLRELKESLTPKPVVKIIAVTNVADRKITAYGTGPYSGQHRAVSDGVATIVLYTVDGELRTKDLPGTWKLPEVQKGFLL